MTNRIQLIIGANSAIAQAFVARLSHVISPTSITTLSRHQDADIALKNYSEPEIARAANLIPTGELDVYIFNGMVHDENIKPEKRLDDLSAETFNHVMKANALVPLLFLKHLMPRLSKQHQCRLVALGARVGSIGDNVLGGWYSYRAAKSALNQLLTCASIELNRYVNQTQFLVFQPGTVTTPLSEPFVKNSTGPNVFSPRFAAERLYSVINDTPADGKVYFKDWNNRIIQW